MQSIQLIGPFKAGLNNQIKIELSSIYKILKIGMERPLSLPIGVYANMQDSERSNLNRPVIQITSTQGNLDSRYQYLISDREILEYDGLFQSIMYITFLQNWDEYGIIDLVFKDMDE